MAAKSAPVMMIAIEEDIFVDDSLSWEVVDPSDDDDNFSYDSSLDDDVVVDEEEVVSAVESDVSMESLVEQISLHQMLVIPPEVDDAGEINDGDYDVDDGTDGGDENHDDDDDLDDELVPKWVNDRFERQRMRKLGKRAFQKMKNSKRLPFAHNRPGCVYGKHGLGLKHSLI